MTKPKILVSRRWPEAVETAMKEKYDVTFNISDKMFYKELLFHPD